MKRNLACWRSSLDEPDGQYTEITRQVAEIASHIAAFGIEFRAAEADLHRVRLDAAVDADAGIAFFLGVVEVAVIAGRREEFRRSCRRLAPSVPARRRSRRPALPSSSKKPLLAAERMPFRLAEMILAWYGRWKNDAAGYPIRGA